MQYEGEVKGLKDFLTGVRGSIAMVTKGDASYSDDSWMKLREVCIHILNCVTLRLSFKLKVRRVVRQVHHIFPEFQLICSVDN